MKGKQKQLKRHIISMRISAEEWNSLNETMKDLHLRRVSDLMREALKLLPAVQSLPAASSGTQTTAG